MTDTPACDGLLRELSRWVANHYATVVPDRRRDEVFWDQAIENVVGGPIEGPRAKGLSTEQRECLLAAFSEVAALAKAADDRASPREASERERTAAGYIARIFQSKGDFLTFIDELSDLAEDPDYLAFIYYPVVNWLTNVSGGLMDMTHDLEEAAKTIDMDSDSLRKLLGLE